VTKQRLRAPLLAMLTLTLLASSSPGGAQSGAASSLVGSSWRLTELQSPNDAISVVRPDDPAKYELALNSDGAVVVRLDCNRGRGRWMSSATSQTQGTIMFTALGMTRVVCPSGSLDTRVARELGLVRTYLLEGDRLTLFMMADNGRQIWMRTAS
jgi:para-nitrobenzyl esterase